MPTQRPREPLVAGTDERPSDVLKASTGGAGAQDASAGSPFARGLLGGALLGLGASAVAAICAQTPLGLGSARLIAGLCIGIGLAFAILTNSRLFAADSHLFSDWLAGRIQPPEAGSCSAVVYAGNLLGASVLAVLVYLGAQYLLAGGAVGRAAVELASEECGLPFAVALVRGVLGGALVCLAMWRLSRPCGTTEVIITAAATMGLMFACGFRYWLVDAYLVPAGLLVHWGKAVLGDAPGLTLGAYLLRCLIPVTLGNTIGAVFTFGVLNWLPNRTSGPVMRIKRPARGAGREKRTDGEV